MNLNPTYKIVAMYFPVDVTKHPVSGSYKGRPTDEMRGLFGQGVEDVNFPDCWLISGAMCFMAVRMGRMSLTSSLLSHYLHSFIQYTMFYRSTFEDDVYKILIQQQIVEIHRRC